jgi:uncharacterized protein YkwD
LVRPFANPIWLAGLLIVGLLSGCNGDGASTPPAGGASLGPGSDGSVLGSTETAQSADCVEGPDVDDLARQALTLVNIERARVGISPLTLSDTLTKAAEEYACALAAEDFFDHFDPLTGDGPRERVAAAGYEFFGIGENLAGGQTTAAEAVEGWLNSPRHRDNLLHPAWKETGIGVRRGGSLRIYWVQEFGTPVSSLTTPATGVSEAHSSPGVAG